MRFQLVVKHGLKELVDITGAIDVDVKQSELEKTLEVAEFLERLFGLRFHINSIGHKGAQRG